MARDKEKEALYKEEGRRRNAIRKKKRLERWVANARYKVGSGMYERLVEERMISTCEWGNSRCDLHGCTGDC